MDPVAQQPKPFLNWKRMNTAFAGAAAGIAGTCFGHPWDLIKVRMQARSEYKGVCDCLVQTVRSDGPQGLFRGIGPPLWGSSILNMVTLSSYNYFNELQIDNKRQHSRTATKTEADLRLTQFNYALSGVGVGLSCSPLVCPIEVVKVRMQLDRGVKGVVNGVPTNDLIRRHKNSWSCFQSILRTEGFSALYRGFYFTTLRDVSYSTVFFVIYEPMKQFIHKQISSTTSPNFSPIPIILSSGLAGAVSWTVVLPLDCAKTLIQQPMEEGKKISKWEILKTHYSKFGTHGFYSGWFAVVSRAFVVSAIRFLVYESMSNFWKISA